MNAKLKTRNLSARVAMWRSFFCLVPTRRYSHVMRHRKAQRIAKEL